jgi:NAD(P)-dependent dehydrogenase (short-subunit alcohol dehydrogenase family)
LADEIGLTDDGSLDELEDLVEELATRKTLRGIVEFLVDHADRLDAGDGATAAAPQPEGASEAGAPAVPSPAPGAAATGGTGEGLGAIGGARAPVDGIPAAAHRYVVSLQDAPAGDAVPPARPVGVTGATPLAAALVDELARRGVVASGGRPDAVGLVVVTDLLEDMTESGGATVDVPALYERLRPLLLDTGHDVVVVSALGGGLGIDPPAPVGPGRPVPAGAGVRGLVKTAALEFPDRRIRLVDVDPAAPVADLARLLADEAAQAEAPVEVGWCGGVRRTPHAVARPIAAPAAAPALSSASVVLLTGGARGITAEVAVALGREHGCRLELLGRSPLPEGDEEPAFAACADRAALRGALARAGWRKPRAIDTEVDRLLAAREVRATLAALAEAGAPVRYHAVDVRDAEALAALVTEIYEHHGRLDGLVHGAGMLDDHLIADKSPDAFARVFATKVGAASTLLGSVRAATADGGWAPPAFVVFFGSIAGVCGNRGQADYAAANDALDAMAAANRDVAARVVALDWGPWSPAAGMVSDSLARLFEESGMGLIEPADGTAVVRDEIGTGAEDGVCQVVVARCSPELMAASLSHGRAVLAASGAAPGGG